jgi:hypothetical protein
VIRVALRRALLRTVLQHAGDVPLLLQRVPHVRELRVVAHALGARGRAAVRGRVEAVRLVVLAVDQDELALEGWTTVSACRARERRRLTAAVGGVGPVGRELELGEALDRRGVDRGRANDGLLDVSDAGLLRGVAVALQGGGQENL